MVGFRKTIYRQATFFCNPLFSSPVKLLYQTHDAYGKIQVLEDSKERFLTFDSPAKQSAVSKHNFDRLSLNYQKVMLLPFCQLERPKKVLILGLGAGCLAKFLLNALPEVKIRVVELRTAVWQTAKDYFSFPEHPNLEVEIADAAFYIEKSALNEAEQGQYDWLIVDVFQDSGIPREVNSKGFFSACHQLLQQNGQLILNYWTSQYREDRTVLDFVKQELFGSFLISDVADCGNHIYFFYPAARQEFTFASKKAIEEWDKLYRLDFKKNLSRLQKINYSCSFRSSSF